MEAHRQKLQKVGHARHSAQKIAICVNIGQARNVCLALIGFSAELEAQSMFGVASVP